MLPTDLTVSAIVEMDGRFLVWEERASGVTVIRQPGGHIAPGESPQQAVVREALEKTRCSVEISQLIGTYLWIQPQTRQQFLRIIFAAELRDEDLSRQVDSGIHAIHWYAINELKRRKKDLCSPVLLRSIEDYLGGQRQSDGWLGRLAPVQQNVSEILANARLV